MKKVELSRYHFLEIVPGEYSMDFELKEHITENGMNGDKVRVRGFLKWDGCMNWSTTHNLMYHFCESDDAQLLHDAFLKVWELGPENIDRWLDQ